MNPRVKYVQATDDYKLELLFTNEESAVYDCKPILEFGVFKELKDVDYFKQVKVSHGSVVWPNEQDICPDTLYLGSER